MKTNLSRRQFLKFSAASLLGIAFSNPSKAWTDWQGEDSLARVAGSSIYVYARADFHSDRIEQIPRDSLLHWYYETSSEQGINRRWYRIWNGFVHSAYVQRVEARLNPVDDVNPESGAPAEVTVPFTTAMRLMPNGRWEPIYRLYYSSVHWVNSRVIGPDGSDWYELEDSYARVYYAPAVHFHIFHSEELSPIFPETPPKEKHIEVNLTEQRLRAYEGERVVLETEVSTGLPQREDVPPGEVATDTPLGDFHITVKCASRHMGGTMMSSDIETSALPGVPWVSFFHKDGYSFHGTYWHDNFGLKMSHGCVNMRSHEAMWLFRWVDPPINRITRQESGWGTRVRIFE